MNSPITRPTTPITIRIRPAVWISSPATVASTAYLRIAPTAIRNSEVPIAMLLPCPAGGRRNAYCPGLDKWSVDRGCLQQDQKLRCSQPRDAEQGGCKAAIGVREAPRKALPVLEQIVEVGRVDGEPDDVGERHVGRVQHGLQVVEVADGEIEAVRGSADQADARIDSEPDTLDAVLWRGR